MLLYQPAKTALPYSAGIPIHFIHDCFKQENTPGLGRTFQPGAENHLTCVVAGGELPAGRVPTWGF